MRNTTYRALQAISAVICCFSTAAFAQAPRTSLAGAMLAVGTGDWVVTALVSLSFGLVSLLQRFKRAEAGDRYLLFVFAHMTGSLASGVLVYLVTQGGFDQPNRFAQALAIGAAGWGGSTVADYVAAKINRQTLLKDRPNE